MLLKLTNECCRSYVGATPSINNEHTHLASNNASGMKDLISLAQFKRSPLDIECSLDYPKFTHIWSDQSLILILGLLLINYFLNGLDLFHFSNGESPPVGTIRLEVSITMAFEALFTL